MKTYDHPGTPMHGWPLIRRETYLLEAFCPHGVGHPIPESISHMDTCRSEGAGTWGIHGCDGCCAGTEAHDCFCANCMIKNDERRPL
jgi:hypothetical protein